jgi:DNA-binding NarL/FixJ family response regulator
VGVVTVDDQAIFRAAAREVIDVTPGFETAGEAASGEEAIALVGRLDPQLVLVDVRMPGMGGLELLDELRRTERDVLELLDGVPADFTGVARAPIVMVVNVPDAAPLSWVEDLEWKAYALVSWRLHTIDHMKQVRKALGR